MYKNLNERNYCKQPDRHVPEIVCGHPLPCPYHTIVVEKSAIAIPNGKKIDRLTHQRLKDIADVLKDL